MGGARHQDHLFFAVHQAQGLLVEPDHALIGTADKQQRRRRDGRQCGGAGQVGSAAARHHRADPVAQPRCRDQRRCAPGAGTEIADPRMAKLELECGPARRILHSLRQHGDIEAVFPGLQVHLFLLRRQQVEQQRGEAALLQALRHPPVARAVPAAAATMGKQDQRRKRGRQGEIAVQPGVARRKADLTGGKGCGWRCHCNTSCRGCMLRDLEAVRCFPVAYRKAGAAARPKVPRTPQE